MMSGMMSSFVTAHVPHAVTALIRMRCPQCRLLHSAIGTGVCGFAGDSPVASRIPKDPDLESKLWGLYAAKCVQAWMHGEKGHKDITVSSLALALLHFL